MKRFISAALLLFFLKGCATTAVESGAGVSTEQEVTALAQTFWSRIDQRAEKYLDQAMKAEALVKQAVAARDGRGVVEGFRQHSEMAGRLRLIENFRKVPAGTQTNEWFATELGRIRQVKAAEEAIVAAYRARPDEEKTNEAKANDMARIAMSVVELEGEEQEARLVQQETASYWASVQAVYIRAVEQAQAERQEEQLRQQSLLLFLGGLQQINRDLQEQDRYNQQQRFQQQILHELRMPTTCHSYGATTTCY